ncbi:hypothetical protein H0O03_01585 [Candidatus Micrarchaeota archaeon]|nr:hypothetical protein [Candidatus Micrarchaeota archaeon]
MTVMLAVRSNASELVESKGFLLNEKKHFPLEKIEGFGTDYEDRILVESIDLNAQYESVFQYYRSPDRAKMHCVTYLENKCGRIANEDAREWLMKQIDTPTGKEIFFLCVKDDKGNRRTFILSGELDLSEAHLSEFQKQVLASMPPSS